MDAINNTFNFETFKKYLKDIADSFEHIDTYHIHSEHKIKVLKSEYVVLSKTNKDILHTFCLDSIHFQLRLYKDYVNDYRKRFCSINNHVYRDYYKLFKIISKYIVETIQDKKILTLIENETFVTYKDLEINKTYDINVVEELYERILNIIQALIEHCDNKDKTLSFHTMRNKQGYDVNNLISSLQFDTHLIKTHINLFCQFLEFFHFHKMKYLNELSHKCEQLYYDMPPIDDVKFTNKNKDDNLNTSQELPKLPNPSPKRQEQPEHNAFLNETQSFFQTDKNEVLDSIVNHNHENTLDHTDKHISDDIPLTIDVSNDNDASNNIIDTLISTVPVTNIDDAHIDDGHIDLHPIQHNETPHIEIASDTNPSPKKKRGRPKKNAL